MAPGALYALGLGEIKLNSALNQPFDAEIELVSATQEDLGALRAALASNDTFTRYGLDRPAFLADFNFRVAKGSGGQDVLRVTSPRPVTEPFVTLLVEANWPRGRLLREYTVLLDPPVFAPGPAAPQPVAAAPRVSSGGATSARVPTPTAETSSQPMRAAELSSSTSPAPGIEPGSTYRVRPHDTLWEIASAANPGSRSDVNRAMVSIYQNNPQAFDNNINVLRAGSTLRIPDASQIRAISAAEASAEVARQYDAWRSGSSAAGAAAEAGRLRLVTPEQGTAAPSTATSAAPTTSQPATAAAATSAAGSSELESRVRQLESELAEAKRLLEVRNAELATLQGGTPAPVEAPVPGAETAAPAATTATPAEAAPTAPVAAEPPKPEKPKKQVVEPPQPSLLERLADYWWVLLGLLGIGLGAMLFKRLRRERGSAEETLEEALGTSDTRSSMPRYTPRSRETDIVVEEKRASDAGRGEAAGVSRLPEPTRKVVTVEDTLSGDGPASMESGDPLAEADFHMAYGLYDQAADLVQLAMKREPQRRDLKLKLLEIYFVWGNKDRFLDLARELGATRAEAPAGQWDKVLIMGKQIAPGDVLFAGAASASSGDSLDMELQSAPGALDLTIPEGDYARPDMDLSETEIAPVDRSGIDFVLDEPVRGKDDSAVLPTIEMPVLAKSGKSTVEIPVLGKSDKSTVKIPVLGKSDMSTSDTQEVTVDALGLDLDSLRSLESMESLDATEAIEMKKRSGGDTVETAAIGEGGSLHDESETDQLSSTALTRISDDTSSMLRDASLEGFVDLSDATGELRALDPTELNVSLGGGVDFELGGEPATMSEVGTKLDLARAYMDMGDPEGARSILDEVLQEGNPNQRQEAERLIASLP
jgi:pilus assembly protein FimV